MVSEERWRLKSLDEKFDRMMRDMEVGRRNWNDINERIERITETTEAVRGIWGRGMTGKEFVCWITFAVVFTALLVAMVAIPK
jgi:hypothetical protein